LLKRLHDGERFATPYEYSGMDIVSRDYVDAYVTQWKAWESGSSH
jgi:hypothetical protein